jgi:hypothetical protein
LEKEVRNIENMNCNGELPKESQLKYDDYELVDNYLMGFN